MDEAGFRWKKLFILECALLLGEGEGTHTPSEQAGEGLI